MERGIEMRMCVLDGKKRRLFIRGRETTGGNEFMLEVRSRKKLFLRASKGPFYIRVGHGDEISIGNQGVFESNGVKVESREIERKFPLLIGHRGLGITPRLLLASASLPLEEDQRASNRMDEDSNCSSIDTEFSGESNGDVGRERMYIKDSGAFFMENSLEGFLRCSAVGVDAVEMDIHVVSGDKGLQCVVVHDFIKNVGECTLLSLEEVLRGVPAELTYNLEIKYPSEDEQVLHKLEEPLDVKIYCDTVMREVETYGGTRKIFYSSFHRKACLELKRSGMKVYLLTEESKDGMLARFEEDVAFALAHSLAGIVVESTILLKHPEISLALCGDLEVYTYGRRNKRLWHIRKQIDLGLAGIITDAIGSLVYLL
jgi:glycerophosphoryl diester phosphodiesterase